MKMFPTMIMGTTRNKSILRGGIGTYFMDRLEDFSINKKSEAIVLDCADNPLGASGFYIKRKFKRASYHAMYKLLRPNTL